MSKSKRVVKTQPEVERAIRALKAAQTKREKRYVDTRIAYVYYNPSERKCTDNIILLPADTVDAHEEYLRLALADILKDADIQARSALRKYRLRRIATFRVDTYEMRPIRKPIDLFEFGSLFEEDKKK